MLEEQSDEQTDISTHLLAICSALGGYEPCIDSPAKEEYVLGDECLGMPSSSSFQR